jgi:hypothetical protein
MATTNCPNCGAPALAGAIYCDDCGFDLRSAASVELPSVVEPAVSGPAAPGEICPTCGQVNRERAAFCENCGTALSQSPLPVYQPPITPARAIPSEQKFTLPTTAARLVIQGSNAHLNLPPDKEEIVLGREDSVSGVFPEINLEPFGAQDAGVSRRHLKIRHSGNKWMVEDLNSVNGTFLNRQRLAPAQLTQLKHGDELRLGKLALIFYVD